MGIKMEVSAQIMLTRRFTMDDYTDERTYQETRRPVDEASTLIAEAYRDPCFFRLEQDKLFSRSWVAVGLTDQLRNPGDTIVVEVASQPIIVTRDREGSLRAFYNVCRHRGTLLLRESCSVKMFQCPYHKWAYDLEGNCIGTPYFETSDIPDHMRPAFDMTGVRNFDRNDYSLFPVNVDSWGPLIFVNLEQEAPPLEEWLGELPERLDDYGLANWVTAQEKTYDFAANWKLIAENYMEHYHLPWVHPELFKVSRVEDHYRWQGDGMYTGFCTMPISRDEESNWLTLPLLETLSEEDQQSAKFVWIFPNVSITVLPNHTFVMMLQPEAYNKTRELTYLLVPPGTDESEHQSEVGQLMSFWDLINTQDLEIVERVQAGIETEAFKAGRMCYHFEELIHRFQNMVIDRMVGINRIPPGDEQERIQMFGHTDGAVSSRETGYLRSDGDRPRQTD